MMAQQQGCAPVFIYTHTRYPTIWLTGTGIYPKPIPVNRSLWISQKYPIPTRSWSPIGYLSGIALCVLMKGKVGYSILKIGWGDVVLTTPCSGVLLLIERRRGESTTYVLSTTTSVHHHHEYLACDVVHTGLYLLAGFRPSKV